jgi:ATP-dependent Clp protease ATP-binding subunit ClpC
MRTQVNMKKAGFGGGSKYAPPALAAKRTGTASAQRAVTSCAALKTRANAGTLIGAASSMKATSFFGSSVRVAGNSSTARRAPRGTGSGKVVTKAMFERFTEKAIKVVMLAQEEARRLGHNFVGTEQLLLGMIG